VIKKNKILFITGDAKIIINEYNDELKSMYLPQRTSIENFWGMLNLALTKPMHILETYTTKPVQIYRTFKYIDEA